MSELSQEALSLLEQARATDEPSAADRDRMRAKLAAQLGTAALTITALAASTASATADAASATAPAAQLATTAGAGSVFGAAGKALLALVLTGVFGGGYWALREPPRAADHASVERAMPPVIPASPSSRPAAPARQARVPDAQAPVREARPKRSAARPAHEAEQGRAALREQRSATERALLEARLRPQPEPQPQTNTDDLAAELALLSQAQEALRDGHAQEALRFAREHAARFARGALREERLGIELLAQCALGNRAPERVGTFFAEVPSSPLAQRVRDACED